MFKFKFYIFIDFYNFCIYILNKLIENASKSCIKAIHSNAILLAR